MLNQIGIDLTETINQLVAELRVNLDFAFYLLVTLECTLEAVLSVKCWIAALVNVSKNLRRYDYALNGTFGAINVLQTSDKKIDFLIQYGLTTWLKVVDGNAQLACVLDKSFQ